MLQYVRNLVVATAAVSLAACTTVRQLSPGQSGNCALAPAADPADQVQPGDDLVIRMKDGRMVTLRVGAVEPRSIAGAASGQASPVQVECDQIESLERREVDKVRTTVLVVGVVALVALFIAAAQAAAYGALMSTL
jgi:hypothetical protein